MPRASAIGAAATPLMAKAAKKRVLVLTFILDVCVSYNWLCD